ncbi:hypothetical protein RHGRI_037469 [Rhododendron griersonianum]|uniref:F-box/LRR-repeat protein 15/At3g58940/PEG3-like LRR domain-containing protein n=1 Tax=Rhododendron griersonianum TaxID=479676 RepID=A0AAV6HXH4_9ERIC|nr:hypothetical protein RHGRI_037469 [Rhododendron griersonianum]
MNIVSIPKLIRGFALQQGRGLRCFTFIYIVQTAKVHMFEDCHYELPQHLYSNSSLRELHFSLCRVTPKRGVDWNSLKELSIGDAILSDEEIQKILVGSSSLQKITVTRDAMGALIVSKSITFMRHSTQLAF